MGKNSLAQRVLIAIGGILLLSFACFLFLSFIGFFGWYYDWIYNGYSSPASPPIVWGIAGTIVCAVPFTIIGIGVILFAFFGSYEKSGESDFQ